MDAAQPRVQIRDFPGLNLSADPHKISPGAARDQVNCYALNDGQLQTRGGVRQASFDWSTVE